jgi:hypothetical protein
MAYLGNFPVIPKPGVMVSTIIFLLLAGKRQKEGDALATPNMA